MRIFAAYGFFLNRSPMLLVTFSTALVRSSFERAVAPLVLSSATTLAAALAAFSRTARSTFLESSAGQVPRRGGDQGRYDKKGPTRASGISIRLPLRQLMGFGRK